MNIEHIDHQIQVNYVQDKEGKDVQEAFTSWLNNFYQPKINERGEHENVHTYRIQAKQMLENQETTLQINMEHCLQEKWVQFIINDFIRYESFIRKGIWNFLQSVRDNEPMPTTNVYMLKITHYRSNTRLRDLKTQLIGALSGIEGTITKSTEVRPELVIGSFKCLMCNTIVKDIEQQFKFTEPKLCTKPGCDNKIKWELDVSNSSFTDFQKLRVQENSSDIPPGGMPRSLDVILRDRIVDSVKPGDRCQFTGYLAVVPDIAALSKPGESNLISSKLTDGFKPQNTTTTDGLTGLKSLGQRDLNYKLVFVAINAQPVQNRFNNNEDYIEENYEEDEEQELQINLEKSEVRKEYFNQRWQRMFQESDLKRIQEMNNNPKIYDHLAKCIAPSVCGSEEIKKGILLMLTGGVQKKTQEKTSLRGDINICIVGDPSTAKSQFLKWVAQFLPRSVYTSGKASSAAGLTASVSRDQETGEYCIEAGALMLADHGVCCIDEFDKMDKRDQTAIHEAMEQQTISITKSGIQATLNARTSILAASNPVYGRYDKSRSLKHNLNISDPIMSRFDLFFVVLDECNAFQDERIANHILNLHKEQENVVIENQQYSEQDLQNYIRCARVIKPVFTKEAAEQVVSEYTKLRIGDLTYSKTSYRITVRQLESLIRLSEGLARVHLKEYITVDFVKEASRLLSNSILKIEKPDIDFENNNFENDQQNNNIIQEDLQQEKKQNTKVKIDADQYTRILREIILYIRQVQKEREQNDDSELGVKIGEITSKISELHHEEIQTEEDAKKMAKIIKLVINKLIRDERFLIVIQDDINPDFKQVIVNANISEEDIK